LLPGLTNVVTSVSLKRGFNMRGKEKLAQLRLSMIFAAVAKEMSEKRKEFAEKHSMRGMLHSSAHAVSIINLELDGMRKLMRSKMQIDQEVFYPDIRVHSRQDEEFLKGRITEYFAIRYRVSLESLRHYLSERGIMSGGILQKFEWGAAEIRSEILKGIDIMILENKIKSPELPDVDIMTLIKRGENNQCEFKATFQWDLRLSLKSKELSRGVINTLAAFSNSDGGNLLIGVEDNGQIIGLDLDYQLLKKKNRDGFLLCLVQELENNISREFVSGIVPEFHSVGSKDICRIRVKQGEEPVWVKESGSDIFYRRVQNKTQKLGPKESAEYIRRKWPLGR